MARFRCSLQSKPGQFQAKCMRSQHHQRSSDGRITSAQVLSHAAVQIPSRNRESIRSARRSRRDSTEFTTTAPSALPALARRRRVRTPASWQSATTLESRVRGTCSVGRNSRPPLDRVRKSAGASAALEAVCWPAKPGRPAHPHIGCAAMRRTGAALLQPSAGMVHTQLRSQ